MDAITRPQTEISTAVALYSPHATGGGGGGIATFPGNSGFSNSQLTNSSSSLPRLPTLPDDVWGKILLKAGTPMIIVCLCVNTGLRRVAKQLLHLTRSLNLTQHFAQVDHFGNYEQRQGDGTTISTATNKKNVNVSTATSTASLKKTKNAVGSSVNTSTSTAPKISKQQIIGVVRAFPSLRDLSITNWTYDDTRPDVANIVCGPSVIPPTVLRVDLQHVDVTTIAIRHLFMSCPRLQSLCIGSHDSVNNTVVRAITRAVTPHLTRNHASSFSSSTWPYNNENNNNENNSNDNNVMNRRPRTNQHQSEQPQQSRRLNELFIVNTRKVGDDAIDNVFRTRIARRVSLKQLPALRIVKVRAFATEGVTVRNCPNLAAVKVRCGMAEGDDSISWDCDDNNINTNITTNTNTTSRADVDSGRRSRYMTGTQTGDYNEGIIRGPALNFTENRNLRTLTFEVTPSNFSSTGTDDSRTDTTSTITSPYSVHHSKKYPKPLPLICTATSLNLSGCPQLCYIYMRRAREDEDVLINNHSRDTVSDDFFNGDGTVRCSLPFLTYLNLYGARELIHNTFLLSLGLSSPSGAQRMPRLKHLVLTGTPIERLNLECFDHLQSVDVCGPMLRDICINQCPNLECVALAGHVRMPLATVTINLPPKCKFSGSRDEWYWERYSTHQSVTFNVHHLLIRH